MITTFALLVLLMKRLGASWKATLIGAGLGTVVTYVMFAYWLRVPLPPGSLNGIVIVFGIPGDSVTAVVIGMLQMKNIQPGPEIFTEKPVEMTALFIAFILANIIMIPLGIAAIRVAAKVLVIQRAVLLPLILLFCIVGSFAINNNSFAIWVMLGMGIVAWMMEANDIPIAPAILGIVLGDMLEKRFLTSMMQSDGRLMAFVERPIAAVLAAITLAIWVSLGWKAWKSWQAARTVAT